MFVYHGDKTKGDQNFPCYFDASFEIQNCNQSPIVRLHSIPNRLPNYDTISISL